jgi:hypothetical protein
MTVAASPLRGQSRPARSFPLDPEPIHVPDEVLADLRRRLRATKWPLDAGNEDGYYGVRRPYLQELVAYWADGFDWRQAERAMNASAVYPSTPDDRRVDRWLTSKTSWASTSATARCRER